MKDPATQTLYTGEHYGREVTLTLMPPETDEHRQFRLTLSVDGKVRGTAYYTDKTGETR